MTFIQFHGAWPALMSPSTPNGDVNVAVLRDLTAYLISKGIGGLYVCGGTGEGVFMSVAERKLVAETVKDKAQGRVPVVVHVGSVATRDAVALAQHAQAIGADGVASILPPFRRSIDDVYLHYETIAAAVPEMPFYPYLFGGEIDALSLMRELVKRIPNIAGAKYTGPDMYELHAIVELGGEGWTIFSGMDQQCIFAAMFDAPANIGSTLNIMPGVYRDIHASYHRGDIVRARDLQIRVNRVTRVFQNYGIFGALYEAMRVLGFDCGEPRLPSPPISLEKRAAYRTALEAVGFAELAAM
jgi:N-acetylneuraminate lyase